MSRQNFSRTTRDDAFLWNARANIGVIDGIAIEEQYMPQKEAGLIYWCENCKFCHTDRMYFDVDHLVPDRQMRGSSNAANTAINAVILCKSYEAGARGCNQAKGARLWPPPGAGLAYTRRELDMNWLEPRLRGANTHWG